MLTNISPAENRPKDNTVSIYKCSAVIIRNTKGPCIQFSSHLRIITPERQVNTAINRQVNTAVRDI